MGIATNPNKTIFIVSLLIAAKNKTAFSIYHSLNLFCKYYFSHDCTVTVGFQHQFSHPIRPHGTLCNAAQCGLLAGRA